MSRPSVKAVSAQAGAGKAASGKAISTKAAARKAGAGKASSSRTGLNAAVPDTAAAIGGPEDRHSLPGLGCWINILDPLIGELVGGCGYDYALIDMEHSPASPDSVLPMIRAVQQGGARALVRIPDKQSRWIGRIMDMGGDGVMVPMVETRAEAEALASAALYAPQGSRGMAAGIVRATGYGLHTDAYLKSCRRDFLLMVQIETRLAVENVSEIVSVSGIDCVFIGPYDLSGSMGNPGEPEHRDTRTAIRRISQSVRQANPSRL